MSEPGKSGFERPDQLDVQESSQVAGPGAQLGAQREALGWSIDHVANQLNMAPRQIQALEEDNYSALPGLVIARGFVRAYAKLLRVDPAPLVAMMAEKPVAAAGEAIELRRALSASFSDSSIQSSSVARRKFKWLVVGLLIAVLGAAAWFEQQNGWLSGLASRFGGSQDETETLIQRLPAPDVTVEQDGIQEQSNGMVETPIDSSGAASAQPGSAAPQSVIEPAASTVLPSAVGVGAGSKDVEASAGQAGKAGHTLTIKTREESWIEIKRVNGGTQFSRLVPSGTTESFNITQPVVVVIGNAAGVEVDFQGKPVNLNAAARNNVARLNLQSQ